MRQSLSQLLQDLHNRNHALTLELVSCTLAGDKVGWQAAQIALFRSFREWNTVIRAVADLEKLTYNTDEVLSFYNEED